jgi:myo-inositol-1(or 4)-monophosphatase
MNSLLQKTKSATISAGEAIMNYYQDSFSVTEKSPDNPVTEADLAADKILKDQLTSLLPEAGWLSEETADNPERLKRNPIWVVDPLDGTKEFVLGIPEFTVSVALVEDKQPILAIIYQPANQELYHALHQGGAFLNDQPIVTSQTGELRGGIVEASRSERKRGEFEPFEDVVNLRTLGSIAYKLARVSAGKSDATWSRGPKSEWDICAGVLLINEAGGRCVDLDNQPFKFNQPFPKVNGIIASNGRIHNQVLDILAPHRHTARVD